MKWLQPEPREVLCQLLEAWLVAHRWMRIWTTRRRLGGVLAALAVDMVLMLSLVVIRLEVLIGDRPLRRDPAEVTNLPEVLSSQPKERSTIKFRIASDVVVGVGMQILAVAILPHFLCLILPAKVYSGGAPVVFLARDIIAPFKEQNSLSRRCEL
jgi:hypothetical protein